MPLAMVETGRRVRILALEAGHGLRGRLAAMGLVPGVEIEVVRNSFKGPFIIALKGSRLIFGRGIAHKIMVA
jgi:ferrous iron transport protein A